MVKFTTILSGQEIALQVAFRGSGPFLGGVFSPTKVIFHPGGVQGYICY